jgi:hypothetical protein
MFVFKQYAQRFYDQIKEPLCLPDFDSAIKQLKYLSGMKNGHLVLAVAESFTHAISRFYHERSTAFTGYEVQYYQFQHSEREIIDYDFVPIFYVQFSLSFSDYNVENWTYSATITMPVIDLIDDEKMHQHTNQWYHEFMQYLNTIEGS